MKGRLKLISKDDVDEALFLTSSAKRRDVVLVGTEGDGGGRDFGVSPDLLLSGDGDGVSVVRRISFPFSAGSPLGLPRFWHSIHCKRNLVTASRGRKAYFSVIWRKKWKKQRKNNIYLTLCHHQSF